MDDSKRLERIEDKLDVVAEKIGDINVILGQQHISLAEHIRRTNLLEKQMEPIKKHVNMVQGAFKLLSLSAMAAAIVEAIRLWTAK